MSINHMFYKRKVSRSGELESNLGPSRLPGERLTLLTHTPPARLSNVRSFSRTTSGTPPAASGVSHHDLGYNIDNSKHGMKATLFARAVLTRGKPTDGLHINASPTYATGISLLI